MSRPKLIMVDELSLGLAPLIVDEMVATLPDIAAGGTIALSGPSPQLHTH
jgi:branched-chain amino acid transport system ATP-binding protein